MTTLDLFAGTGWGVALGQLGEKEYPVDVMPQVAETRKLNGLERIAYADVWDIHQADSLQVETLIASPPCQTFSTAGSGSGRQALNDVLAVLHDFPYGDVAKLRSFGELFGDDRTSLVLAPLEYVHRFRPKYIALEQVPTVQPVWDALKPVLESLGYGVWTNYVRAETFGVPQTRKRSILLAVLGSPMSPPRQTHSRYHTRTPYKMDSGLLPWVSTEDELGQSTIAATGKLRTHLKLTKMPGASVRPVDTPAMTMAFGNDHGTPRWFSCREDADLWVPRPNEAIHGLADKVTLQEVASLQTYPHSFVFGGSMAWQYKQVGNAVPPRLAKALLEHLWNH